VSAVVLSRPSPVVSDLPSVGFMSTWAAAVSGGGVVELFSIVVLSLLRVDLLPDKWPHLCPFPFFFFFFF
jgi:hypothetical protein